MGRPYVAQAGPDACAAGHTRDRVWAHRCRAQVVMSNDKAAEAREGMFDNIAGKAKEVAGAVTGKDDLVEEGQLQQAESRHRKAALADEAIADAKQDEAVREATETRREADQQEAAARAEAGREEAAIE